MRIIVGLGNPGKDHERTRHNAGFRAVEAFRERRGDAFDGWKKKFDGLISTGRIGDEKVALLLPQTFMNRSGVAVQMAASFWKATPKDVIVVVDDFMLPLGQLRLRAGGSAGGHNGLTSVIRQLGTQAFPRLRIGIGSPRMDTVPKEDFVLERFNEDEERELETVFDKAVRTLDLALEQDLDAAMNYCNGTEGA